MKVELFKGDRNRDVKSIEFTSSIVHDYNTGKDLIVMPKLMNTEEYAYDLKVFVVVNTIKKGS